jgi:NADPH:quinone reductase-like Zn-dependent oxidoreductase
MVTKTDSREVTEDVAASAASVETTKDTNKLSFGARVRSALHVTRSRSFDKQRDQTRNDDDAKGDDKESDSPSRRKDSRNNNSPSLVEVVDSTREDVEYAAIQKSTSCTGSLFRLAGDKRQQKAVIKEPSDKPEEVFGMIIEEIPEPATDKDVIIKVTASTVSLFDCNLRKGASFESIEFPFTPGMDVVGSIIKCGSKVETFKVGDRVAALVLFGGNARYINVPVSSLVEVPRSCDAAEAVCLVSTYMTAYQALKIVTKDGFSLEGKCVLITGGIEPIGQALVQLCVQAGASEIYATAPIMRHKYVKSVLGVKPLAPEPEDWSPVTKERMDVVFDGTCQSPYGALRNDGVMVCLGLSALMNRESAGIFGAPLSAYWARLKGHVLPNTHVYDLWDSFSQDKTTFKVSTFFVSFRGTIVALCCAFSQRISLRFRWTWTFFYIY